MNWTDIPCNELLKRVFTKPPKMGDIDLFEIDINRDGPTVIVNFDLVGVVPDAPPAKWGSEFNRCRMGLYCTGVSELSITGLATNIIAKIDLNITNEGAIIIINSDVFTMRFKCKDVNVTGPSVYKSN